MKYSILLTILFLTCNDTSNTTNTVKSDDFLDKRKSTIEEVVKDNFTPTAVWSEQTAFFHDFNEEISNTYRIVEVETFKEKYNFVFVDFTVGARVFREVIRVVKMYDGKYIDSFFTCYSLKCPKKLTDKIDEWEKGSLSTYLKEKI